MIRIELDNKWYELPEGWDDLTLQQFIDVCEIGIPDKLQSIWETTAKLGGAEEGKQREVAEAEYNHAFDQITFEDNVKNFPEYYGKVLESISDIPTDIIDLIHHEPRTDFFDQYIKYIVLSSFTLYPLVNSDKGFIPYEPEGPGYVEILGEKYLMPTTLKLFGEKQELANEPIVSFAEASAIELAWDGLKNKGVNQLPMFCSIYLRKKDEKYIESVAIERVELFKSMSMKEVWTLFFCIAKRGREYQSYIQTSLQKAMAIASHHLQD